MKGLSRRFVNHKGKAYEVKKKKVKEETAIGFFDLWQYATVAEMAATWVSVGLAVVCAAGMIAAVVVYGELTSLFVQRHRAQATTSHAHILRLFGGGELLEDGDRDAHMDALVRDAVAFAAASAGIMALQLATAGAAVGLANWAAASMVRRLRARLLAAVLRQEIAYFDTNTSMNFAAALTEEMEKIRAGCGEHVPMTAYLAGTAGVGGVLALCYGWQLTLSALAVVPFALLVAATVAKYQTRWAGAEATAYAGAGRVAEEALAAVRTVRAFAGESREADRYREALRGASAAARRRAAWAAGGAGLGSLLTYMLNAVVFAYGATLCVRDMDLPPQERQYHPGVMVIVLFCTFMGAQNIAMCQPHLEVVASARGAAAALFPLLRRKTRVDARSEGGLRPPTFRGDIVFDNVYFNYPSRPDVKVLRGLSLRIRAGEMVALVGGSGSGKSTVLQLLQRLYDPHAGRIAVDGHRLADLHLHHFRRSIGVVGQEPVLFSGTIRENIALGEEDVTMEQVVAAARAAHAHHFISKLARGYETELGERCALSGGQKQRVALARALLRDPTLLLLDEPTSALDPAAERQVQAALDAASNGRTTIVVSHRLSTIVNASRIVYIEQGAVLEQGTHDELMAQRGAYWRLVQEDLTHRSMGKPVQPNGDATEPDDDEETDDEPAVPPAPLQRSYHPGGTAAAEGSVRGSVRGSMRCGAGPHLAVPSLTSDLCPGTETGGEGEEGEESAGDGTASGWALLRLNGPEWPLLVAGAAASFLVGATMPTFAWLFSKLYGMFAWSNGEEILVQSRLYAAGFAGVAALCGVASLAHTWAFGVAGSRLTDRLRFLTFRSFLAQEQAWFDRPQNSVGALCARLATDCAAVQGATGTRLGTVVQGVSTMVLGVALAMVFSWKMTLVSLVSVPFVIGGICLEGWATRRADIRERHAVEHASRLATEAVFNVRTVHSLGVEETMLQRYSHALSAARSGAVRAQAARALVYGMCLCAPTFGYAVSLAYGAYLIAREDLQYEYVILVSEALIYGAWMLAEALSFAPSFAAARRAGGRIVAQLAREPSIATASTAADPPGWVADGEVSLSDVQFEYPSRPGVPVLRGLSLTASAGRTVALVGASGSGKSTVLQLLLRNYDADAGSVRLDGREVTTKVSVAGLRAQLGLVQQEPVLFSRSLRDNIAYGAEREVSMAEVVAAAQQANIHNFIASLPQGYDTVLGGASGGGALSGGQKQRVCIARALVRDPRVLLLDEATSALDAAGEKAVQAALQAAACGRTTVTIAHRLATVRHAHLILVVHRGVVAESGTHDELLRRRGLYWDLWQQQAPPAT